MSMSVFVTSIKRTDTMGIVVEASNGSQDGPPFVRFTLPPSTPVDSCYIGKRYELTITEGNK